MVYIIIAKKIIITKSKKEYAKLQEKYHRKWTPFYGACFDKGVLRYESYLNHELSWAKLAKELVERCGE